MGTEQVTKIEKKPELKNNNNNLDFYISRYKEQSNDEKKEISFQDLLDDEMRKLREDR